MTSLTRVLTILAVVSLAGCVAVHQASETTAVITPTVAAKPCPFSYLGEWHYIAGSQVQKVEDPTLLDGATSFVQNSIEPCLPWYEEVEVYMLQHPDNHDLVLVEYDLPYGTHHLVSTLLLLRTGGDWMELTVPPYPTVAFYTVDADLMGFVWECDGWSLYLGARNTEFYHGMDHPEYAVFYQSRDNGSSWIPPSINGSPPFRLVYGVSWHPLEPPSISLPDSTVLATGFYDEERERLTRFAWAEETRALYAFTYPFHPTPTPPPIP